MTAPPKYPRIPHLAPSAAATQDDTILPAQERPALLTKEVVVEEKLDGQNVMLWTEHGVPQVGTRGGADTSDRSGERGRVKAWASMHADALASGLGDRYVLYGEWLRRRHAVPYERLPSELIGLDVLDRDTGRFLTVDERDAVLERIGVARPPQRFRGTLGTMERLDALFGTSAFGTTKAEGLIVRTADGSEPRIVKYVDPDWQGVGSASWAGENGLDA